MQIDWIARSEKLSLSVRNFVGGRWAEMGGESIEKHSPRDGRLLYQLGVGVAYEVIDAVANARKAFDDGRWSKLPVQGRREVLLKLASLMESHREELALLECLDVGKPISDALDSDVPTAIASLRYNAQAADSVISKVYATDRSSLSYELRRPVGVVAGIVGWNFPLVLAVSKIGPVLATGNSLVLKPSELTSLTTMRIAELAVEAGVPEGVFNVIHGGAEIGAALAHHRDIDLVTFTGSTRTGKSLLIAAGQSNMKRLILECGGKAPAIVFDDCPNLEGVGESVVTRAFWNQGAVCTATSRLVVQESIKDELLRIVTKKASMLSPGDPLNPATKFGAIVSLNHQQKILTYIADGEKHGARMIHRSSAVRPFEAGYYVPPTIFDDVAPEQNIAQEEIFGPVLSIMSFRDEEEAIKIANNTIYGLSAIVWTKNIGRAHRVTQGIKAGLITVNGTDSPVGGPGEGVISVGGLKESGIGTEGGLEGLEAYMSKTAVQVFV